MQSVTAGNLTINGSGSASGGTYQQVTIRGQGKITGDLECTSFKCMGESEVCGRIAAKSVKIMGNSVFEGGMSAGTVKIMGQSDITGDVTVKSLSCSGQTQVNGNIAGDEIHLKGMLQIKGNCETERLLSRGLLEVDGLLNADHIDIKLYGECRAKEIGGASITVRKWGMLGFFKGWFGPVLTSFLTADIIEGDEIRLEYTKADIVRGNRVTIGPGCEIGLVEYKETLHTDKEAILKTHTKL